MDKLMYENMNLLVNNKKFKVYITIGISMEDYLFLEKDNEIVRITRGSGEYENDIGDFMLRTNLPRKQLRFAKAAMKELAIPKSISNMPDVGMIKFSLKKEYLNKRNELYNEKHNELIKEGAK